MFQNLNNNYFIGFAMPKIVEFGIIYLHLYAYFLLSSKVMVFNFFQNCEGVHIGFRGLDDLK